MPEYLAPGVFVEEIDGGSKPIEGVGVSTAAFIGYAKSGEFNKPIFITSWGDFCRIFGEEDVKVLKPLSAELGESTIALLQDKRQKKKPLLQYAEDRLKSAYESRQASKAPKGEKSDNLVEFAKKNSIPLSPEPYIEGCYLAYAVKGFFDNGGGRCYIVRVPRPAGPPRSNGSTGPKWEADLALFNQSFEAPKDSSKALPATASVGGVGVRALQAGEAGNDIKVEVVHGPGDDEFRLKFTQGAKVEELPTKKNEYFKPETAKGATSFAEITEVTTKTRPEANVFELMGGKNAVDLTPAKLPLANEIAKILDFEDDFVGDEDERRGAKGLTVLDDVNFIAVPDIMAGVFERVASPGGGLGPEICVIDKNKREAIFNVQKELVDYCELLNDRMAILDPIPDQTPQEVGDSIRGKFSCDHGQAALYYPWIKVPDMLHRREKATIMVPPCGHMAGVWARTAIERGVHKAPANEAVMGAVGLAYDVTKGDQEKLNPLGVNCIRTFPSSGIRVWGARTLATVSNPSWRYVNVRNLSNYLKRSIDRGMQWVVFEPNDHDLWGRVRRNISAFLWTSWKEGMLFGATPGEAYYVKCDEETNPQEMRDLGRLYVEVGFNPVKPAEFVIIRMGQWSGGSESSES